jgi:hypothetical protein
MGVASGLFFILLFPLGLTAIWAPFIERSIWAHDWFYSILGWLVYAVLGIAMFFAKKRAAVRFIMFLLIVLLLANIHGCKIAYDIGCNI